MYPRAPADSVPETVATELPSRYSVCELVLADSTTWCQWPSLTRPGEAIAAPMLLIQNWPCSRPSVPTYKAGTQPPDSGLLVSGALSSSNSTPPPVDPAVMLNHISTLFGPVDTWSEDGSSRYEEAPLNDAAVRSANGPPTPSVTSL